jgi:hypothetical protein
MYSTPSVAPWGNAEAKTVRKMIERLYRTRGIIRDAAGASHARESSCYILIDAVASRE